ncbi:hypothetical protein BS47DRAFT_1249123, partial [Hydnum rufescens UP504]
WKNWSHQFVAKHSDRLTSLWSSGLDTVHAAALNPENTKNYFDMLKKAYNTHHFCDCNIYNFDESSYPLSASGRECVVGQKGSKCQKKRCSGDKENVMMLAAICTDGTSI